MNLILILIYTFQGAQICLFTQIFPMLLAENGFNFEQQGFYSFINYPFNFKLLFAPLVDLIHTPILGKRKSYVLPIYLINSVLLFWLSEIQIFANFQYLQILGFLICLLLGIQDVAIDGMAFEYCKGTNESATLHQNIGFTLGTSIIGNLMFNVSHSMKLLTIDTFLKMNSVFGLILLIVVSMRFKENNQLAKQQQTFSQLTQVLKKFFGQRLMIQFLAISFFERYALSTLDSTFRLKMIKLGFDKALISVVDILLIPVKLGTGILYQKYFLKYDFSYFKQYQLLRLLPTIVAGTTLYCMEFNYFTHPYMTYFGVFISSLLWLVSFNLNYIVRGNFIQKLTIPGYEATSITIMNSVSQIGFKSASSVSLFCAQHLNYYNFLGIGSGLHLAFCTTFGFFYKKIVSQREQLRQKLQ